MHNAITSAAAHQWCLPDEITYHIGQCLTAQQTLHLTSTCKALLSIRFPLHPLHFKSPLKIEAFLAHLAQLENQQAGCDSLFYSNRFTTVTKIHINLSKNQSTDHIDALAQKLPAITVLSLDVNSSVTSAQFENFCHALKNFRHLTHIQLKARDDYLETENPSTLWVFARLQQLTIEKSNRTVLSPKIWQLNQLQTLTIEHCDKLITLPAEIGRLNQLQTLTIQECRNLATLPSEIGQLKQLQSLTISGGKLTTLPAEIGQLNQLQTLTINCNKLTTLPVEIGQLKQLQNLTIKKCENLTTLPTEIGQLKQLQSLTIKDCYNLTSLPPEIRQLNQLQSLTIQYCYKLTTLPEEIVELAQRNNFNLPTQFKREHQ